MPTTDPQSPEQIATTADAAKQAALALDIMANSSANTTNKLGDLGSYALDAKSALNSFNSTITEYGISLNNSTALTDKQTTQFGLLTSAVLGTREGFKNLHNIDTGNLSTITDQVIYLTSTFTDAQSGIGQLVNFASQAFGKMVPQAVINQGISAVKGFVLNLVQSADNALRVQNAFIQLSAKTGNLSEVFAAAGPNLKNLNALLEKQTALVANAVKTTGLAPEVIQNYYTQLGTIPKALESNVKSSGSAANSVSMLTASIKVATGTGRTFTDVVDDMKLAFKDYNLTGEDALLFTTRISEISNKFGTNLDVVRESLRSTAGIFKMFGNEAEASSRILNNYVGALKSTGLSGDAAVEVVTSMTHAVSNLSIAQKSFLSAQTGGPGGLMGGFQIEKMLRDGKLDEVFEKVRTQMQRQFGKIATLDEASNSPQAAAQLTKQMMVLRQGPLGQFAKSDQEAIRILEGFKAKQEGRSMPGELSSRVVQQTMDKGTAIQEKSYTELSRIRGILEGGRSAADIANLGFTQRGLTAGMGSPFELSESQRKSKQNLSLFRKTNEVAGGKLSQNYARSIETRSPTDNTNKRAAESIKEIFKLLEDIPQSMRAPLDALNQAISSNKTINNRIAEEQLKKDIDQAKATAENYSSSGAVGAAANRATGINNAARRATTNNGSGQSGIRSVAAQGPVPKLGELTVNITGYCIKCKREIDGGQQAAAVNPASMGT
jgi:hypothetical protein